MDEIFEVYGQAMVSAVSALAILGISNWFLFNGPLGQYMFSVLSSLLQ